MRLDAVDEHRHGFHAALFHAANQVREIRLFGDDVLPIEQNRDGWRVSGQSTRLFSLVPFEILTHRCRPRCANCLNVRVVATQRRSLLRRLWAFLAGEHAHQSTSGLRIFADDRVAGAKVFASDVRKRLFHVFHPSLVPVRVHREPVPEILRLSSGHKLEERGSNLQEAQVTDELVLLLAAAEFGENRLHRGRRSRFLSVWRGFHLK